MSGAHFGSCLACIAATKTLAGDILEPTVRSLVWLAGFAAGVRVADLPIGPEGLLCDAHREAFEEYRKAFLPTEPAIEIARGAENAVEIATDAEQALSIIGNGR